MVAEITARNLLPSLSWAKPQGCDLVKQVAVRTLAELAVSTALLSVVALFVPTTAGISILAGALSVQLIVSSLFRSLGAFARHKENQRGPHQKFFEELKIICDWGTGASFALFTGLNAQALVHELGHWGAAKAVFNSAMNPKIEIYPPFAGATTYSNFRMTAFGKKLGFGGSMFFVIASGPGLTLLLSSFFLALGVALRKKHPLLSKYLICLGLLDFFIHTIYAAGAPFNNPKALSDDFVHLSRYGVPPLAAAIAFVATPILVIQGVLWCEKKDLRSQ